MAIIEDKEMINGQEVSILVEMDEVLPTAQGPYKDLREGKAEQILSTTSQLFGKALQLIRNCSAQMVEGIDQMDQAIRPEEVEVQLAIRLDSQVGAVLAKASAGAQMQVKLKWSLK